MPSTGPSPAGPRWSGRARERRRRGAPAARGWSVVGWVSWSSFPAGLEHQSERHAMGAAEPALIGPRVVETIAVRIQPPVEPGSERQADLRVPLERVLVAEPQGQQLPEAQLRPRADALGVVARVERVHGQPQAGQGPEPGREYRGTPQPR